MRAACSSPSAIDLSCSTCIRAGDVHDCATLCRRATMLRQGPGRQACPSPPPIFAEPARSNQPSPARENLHRPRVLCGIFDAFILCSEQRPFGSRHGHCCAACSTRSTSTVSSVTLQIITSVGHTTISRVPLTRLASCRYGRNRAFSALASNSRSRLHDPGRGDARSAAQMRSA